METFSTQNFANSLKFCAVNVLLSDGRSLICSTASKFLQKQNSDSNYVTVAELNLEGEKIGETSFRLDSVVDYFITKVTNNFYLDSEPYD